MPTQYTTLDAAILLAIAFGKREFYQIDAVPNVREEATRIAVLQAGAEAWRIVDRRLQALRKQGRIRYTRQSRKNPEGGWLIVEAP